MAEHTTRVEYRTHFTYPFLEHKGLSSFGPPASSVPAADAAAMQYDDGYYWAGKTLGHQRRIVIESEWEEIE